MMTATPTKCPPIPQLRAYALGRLSDLDSDVVFEHLQGCASCAAELETIDDGEDSLIVELRQPDPLAEFGEEPDCQVAVVKALGALASAHEGLTATSNFEFPLQIGEYEIVRPLGRGGMGNVYLARHTKLGREVALKVLASHRLADARMRQRFDAEMRAVGALSHPNIVTAHDARDIDGTAVLVTEFIDGSDLGKIVQLGGPLSIADSCEIASKVAIALAYTHAQGFVHRDIKPSNVMLSRTGEIKLLDLGLARFQFTDPDHPEITGTGQTMGTADYIAPEQVTDSRSVDIRADIYSLGCTLMKLLTGFAPFADEAHETPFAKMTAHVSTSAPRLSDRLPQVPKELAALVDSMLQKDPSKRPQTPMEVTQRLATFSKGSNLHALCERAVIATPSGQVVSPLSTQPATKSVLHRRVPFYVAIASGLLGIVLGLVFGILIKITYPDGTTVEIDVPLTPDAQVAIESNPNATPQAGVAESSNTLEPSSADYEPMAFAVLLEESDLAAADLAAEREKMTNQPDGNITSLTTGRGTWYRLADGVEAPIVAMIGDQRFALASRASNQRLGWSDLDGHILSAQSSAMGSDGPNIEMRFDEILTRHLQKVTGQNLNRSLGIVVDKEIIAAPIIRTELRNSSISLSGIRSPEVQRFIMQCVQGGLVDPIKREQMPLSKSIDKQIEGVWIIPDSAPNGGKQPVSLLVFDNGRVFSTENGKEFKVGSYAINTETSPTQIDINLLIPEPENRCGIFEILPTGEIRLDYGDSPEHRPKLIADDGSIYPLTRVGDFPASVAEAMKLMPILGTERTGSIIQMIQLKPLPMAMLVDTLKKGQSAINASKANRALKELGIAFHNFHDTYNKFPGSKNILEGSREPRATPPYPFSWRVAILPFIEQNELFEQYRFDEPWDSEQNMKLLEKMPEIFRSPFAPKSQPGGETNFMGFATEQGALGLGDGEEMRNFTDGTSNTLLLVETSKSVPWTKPEDLTDTDVQPFDGQPLRYLMCDGSVKSMQPIDNELLHKLITRNGGEPVR
jgi:serine/threonine protein kinase